MSTDPALSRSFYANLLGWSVQEMPMGPGFTYQMLQAGETPFGGIVPLENAPNVPSHWMSYITCEDVDATCAKIAELGGKVCVPPTDIPNVGRFAVAEDPTGAYFSPFKSLHEQPEPDMPAMYTPCWIELMTSDQKKANDFYAKVFGYTIKDNDMGGQTGIYSIYHRGEKMTAGCMTIPPGAAAMGVPPHWLIYFFVPDVDARTEKARSLDAQVHVPPMDIPGIGRFSVIQDPAGAVCALFTGGSM
jgi:predicted enzyme related to lactoylglutathione lyase